MTPTTLIPFVLSNDAGSQCQDPFPTWNPKHNIHMHFFCQLMEWDIFIASCYWSILDYEGIFISFVSGNISRKCAAKGIDQWSLPFTMHFYMIGKLRKQNITYVLFANLQLFHWFSCFWKKWRKYTKMIIINNRVMFPVGKNLRIWLPAFHYIILASPIPLIIW